MTSFFCKFKQINKIDLTMGSLLVLKIRGGGHDVVRNTMCRYIHFCLVKRFSFFSHD